MNIGSPSQGTDFALDVMGRYLCNTYDEALANSDATFRASAKDRNGNSLPPRGDMRPFDFVIVGGGTFSAALAEHLWFRSTGRSERILGARSRSVLAARAHAECAIARHRTGDLGSVLECRSGIGLSQFGPGLLRGRPVDLVGRLVPALIGVRDFDRLAAVGARRPQRQEAAERRQWLFPTVRPTDRRHRDERLYLWRAAQRFARTAIWGPLLEIACKVRSRSTSCRTRQASRFWTRHLRCRTSPICSESYADPTANGR